MAPSSTAGEAAEDHWIHQQPDGVDGGGSADSWAERCACHDAVDDPAGGVLPLGFPIRDQDVDVWVCPGRLVRREYHSGRSSLRLTQHVRDRRKEVSEVACRLRLVRPSSAQDGHRFVIAGNSYVDHHVQ